MKIIYFHGFASSHATGTAELLRKLLPSAQVIAPDIPIDPAEALPYLQQLCEEEKPDLIIGTSMGGMYAQQMRGYVRICVNPALNMSTQSKALKTGTYKYLNGRYDKAKDFKITRDIIQHWNQMERAQFKGITDFDKEHCYGLFGMNDPIVHTYDLFHKYYPHAIRFDGEHQLNEKALKKTVLPLINELLGDKNTDQ